MHMLQFELWKDCSNNCSFCWNKEHIHNITNNNIKINNIQYVIDKINTNIIDNYDVISIIGGEFFEGQILDPIVNKKFFELIDDFIKLIKTNRIEQIFIMLSFMKEKLPDLDTLINKFKENNCLNKLLLCTSYDEEGRFINDMQKNIWFSNINKYKDINCRIHIETIITQSFLEAVLTNKFNISYFLNNSISIDFIRPRVLIDKDKNDITKDKTKELLPFFYPKRETFLQFLQYLNKYYPEKLKDLYSMEIRALDVDLVSEGRIMHRNVDKYIEDIEKDFILPCGHAYNFAGYCDSDKCMICDIKPFIEEVL